MANHFPTAFLHILLRDLQSIYDLEIKKRFIFNRLRRLTVEELVCLLEILFTGGYRRVREAEWVRMALLDRRLLIESWGREGIDMLRGLALQSGMNRAKRFLSNLSSQCEGMSGYVWEEEQPMEYIPVGMRVSLARGWDRNILERLLSDPCPRVIKALLDNPRITERDVLKIASRRPNSQEILTIISTHKRWIPRYRIKKALVLSPYTPTGVAVSLLGSFLYKDLKSVASNRILHPMVRNAAKEMISEREQVS